MKHLILFFAVSVACWARDLSVEYKTAELQVGGKTITAYIADDEAKREKGLMFVTELKKDEGMIFVFEEERPLAFWMKNTLIPLSIGFFDRKGKLIDIQEMQVAKSLMLQVPPSYPSQGPAQFALEMNKGWFARNKIAVGAYLKLKKKSSSTLLNSSLINSVHR